MIALPAADAAAFREQHLAWFEMGTEKLGIEITEVLAVSGQRLALTRALIGYSSGFPLEMLSVTQWNEGGDRLEKMFQFDGDDVDGALAELDRLRVAVDPQDDAR